MVAQSTSARTIHFNKIYTRLSSQTQIQRNILEKTIDLLENGNTIPFIARYRKEITKGLDENQLRTIQSSYTELYSLEERKISVLNQIEKQEKLTPELEAEINAAESLQKVEDLYLPFKPKHRTLGAKARAKGLGPLADMIRANETYDHPMKEIVAPFVDPEKEVNDVSEALEGAVDIVAEDIGSAPEAREFVRTVVFHRNMIKTAVQDDALSPESPPKTPEGKPVDPYKFENYFQISKPGQQLKSYQLLAINRAENYGVINYEIETPEEDMIHELQKKYLHGHSPKTNKFYTYYKKGIEYGFKRYIIRSIKREYWNHLLEQAENHAIQVFADNLKHLLLTPPLKNRGIIGIDPGYRTGCKVAVIDEYGNYLDNSNIYPHDPQNKTSAALRILHDLAQKYGIFTFAIGNGTASRETEQLLADFIKKFKHDGLPYEYALVNEAGASVYSASKLANEEFPNLDATVRGAISIARRLQDPLSELIKIDPKSIGVGQYQHDVNQKKLREKLDAVIEDCVNGVGVNLNTASSRLLEYVSGLSSTLGKRIVSYRKTNGPFESRSQLKDVSGIGPKTFEQCAGFLKIRNAENVLDRTFVHPESYSLTIKILEQVNLIPADLVNSKKTNDVHQKLANIRLDKKAQELGEDSDKIRYLIDQLLKPNLDPRDELEPVLLRHDVMSIEDLKEGMILKGTVRNVVDFGAFIDIGVKHNGLVHKSEIANEFVKDPRKYLAVGEVYDFMILDVDKARHRIQLSLKQVPESKQEKSL